MFRKRRLSLDKEVKFHRGFTLIEIIVVLIILGVLAVLAMTTLFSNIQKSYAAEAMATMAAYKNNIEGCLTQHVGQEALCALPLQASKSFTYSFSTPPSNGSPDWILVAILKSDPVQTIEMVRTH